MAIISGPRALMETLNVSIGLPDAILIPTSGIFIGKRIHKVIIQPKLQNVFVAFDGEAATTNDMFLSVWDIYEDEDYYNLAKWRFIEEAASAKLLVIPFYVV